MKAKIKYLSLAPLKIIIRYKYLILSIIGYLAYFMIFHNGESNCIVKRTIGFPCPGCGMTRALKYLLTFDFKQAFFYHPLVFIMPFLIILFLYQDTRLLSKLAHSKLLLITVITLFVLVYIFRMILYFPDVEPMNYFENSIIQKLLLR